MSKADVEINLPKVNGANWETGVAFAGTGLIGLLLFLTTLNAGPLWRDETNSLNMAQMPSLKEVWNNMPFESFPALYVLVLRGYSLLGLADGDVGIRILGFFIGLACLGSLWYSAMCFGARSPILSIALLGSLPSFLFTAQSNRAYGLAICLLVLNFGLLWRVVESPNRTRIIWAAVMGILLLHCVYYGAVFLCAMLFAAALVLARRRQWKALTTLALFGALEGATLILYLPILQRASSYAAMMRVPFDRSLLWHKVCQAMSISTGSQAGGTNRSAIWIWIVLIIVGLVAAMMLQIRQTRSGSQTVGPSFSDERAADLSLFSVVSLLCGTGAYIGFLFKLQFPTEPWYYLGMFALCAISLDGVLTANWPALRPAGLLRIGVLLLLFGLGGKAIWEEAITRRSNVDLIADVLGRQAETGDLIVVQGAWEGLTFDRYYKGHSTWVTVPPIDSHKVHRTDLVLEKVNQQEPMKAVLTAVTTTLKQGKRVWVVGYLAPLSSTQPANSRQQPSRQRWLGEYMWNWISELTSHISNTALQMKIIEIPINSPVKSFERLPLMQFSGYKPIRE
jgi:hypothetical protein